MGCGRSASSLKLLAKLLPSDGDSGVADTVIAVPGNICRSSVLYQFPALRSHTARGRDHRDRRRESAHADFLAMHNVVQPGCIEFQDLVDSFGVLQTRD